MTTKKISASLLSCALILSALGPAPCRAAAGIAARPVNAGAAGLPVFVRAAVAPATELPASGLQSAQFFFQSQIPSQVPAIAPEIKGVVPVQPAAARPSAVIQAKAGALNAPVVPASTQLNAFNKSVSPDKGGAVDKSASDVLWDGSSQKKDSPLPVLGRENSSATGLTAPAVFRAADEPKAVPNPVARALDSLRLSKGGSRWIAALSITTVIGSLVSGLALGPHTAAFEIFRGASIFWFALGSIILHEVAHAWTAEKQGDVSARMAGQVSVNPWAFMNAGSATLLLVTSLLGFPFGFFFTVMQNGFIKPENKGPMAKVAAAGPAMNLALAAAFIGLAEGVKFLVPGLAALPWIGGALRLAVLMGVLNIVMGVSNLIPLGPLDGQKVVRAAVPNKFVALFDKITVPIGLIALLGLMIYPIIDGFLHPGKAGGAVLPIAQTGNPYIMTMVAMGVIVWAIAMLPWVKAKIASFKKGLERRAVLAAGGYEISLTRPILTGFVPRGAMLAAAIAVPWSGAADVPKPTGKYVMTDPATVQAGAVDKVVDLATGKLVTLDNALLTQVKNGDYLMLHNGVMHALLPASVVGGPASVRTMISTARIAQFIGNADNGRVLLTPAQVAIVKDLSKALKAPVYELDWTPADGKAGDFAENLGRVGPAGVYFVSVSTLKEIEAASPEKRPAMIEALSRELAALAR